MPRAVDFMPDRGAKQPPLKQTPLRLERAILARASNEGAAMSTPQAPFDAARMEALERRLRAVEDVLAIQNLKARYAAFCDDNYNADAIAALFTEDAVWEAPKLGRFDGREAIREFFRGAQGIFSFAIHYSLNGQIEVDGDSARADWFLFMPCTLADSERAFWRAGIDHEDYVRVGDRWMFKRKRSTPLFSTPFEEGWARTRFA